MSPISDPERIGAFRSACSVAVRRVGVDGDHSSASEWVRVAFWMRFIVFLDGTQ